MDLSPEDRAQNYYNNYSKIYENERRYGYYSLINNLEFEKIKPFAKNKKALEIGCGTGLILERTNGVAKNALGVDISKGMLDVCKKKGLCVQQASATKLPFEDSCFDLVYSFKVLPHIPEIKKALVEIARVTRPNGRMVLEFYNPYSFKGLNDNIRIRIKKGNPVYLKHYCLKQIKSILPPNVKIISTRGIRIWGCCAYCYTLPILKNIFIFFDRISCDSFFRLFGGYFILELIVEK